MEIAKIIAENIQNLLDERKIPATDLANYLGVARQTITNYLKAVSVIDSVQLVKVAEYFNVSASDLLHENTHAGRPEILFRTALNYSEAIAGVQKQITDYLAAYQNLARKIRKNICYFPEQYNLMVMYQNNVIDVNFDCQNYFDTKLKVDENMDREIARIADEQRRLLGLGDNGAVSLIPALTARGVNVIFIDLKTSEISGLSICDETSGCYIFVNSNTSITAERQLFTVAHEYGHIILHRPIYHRRLRQYSENGEKKNLLDSMADCFAGYLLCPEKILSQYANAFLAVKSDLNELLRAGIPVKLKLQISFQSLIVALKRYGYISQSVVGEYFRLIKSQGIDRIEPYSITEYSIQNETFIREKQVNILYMLSSAYTGGFLKGDTKNAIAYFADCTQQQAEEMLNRWDAEQRNLSQVFNLTI